MAHDVFGIVGTTVAGAFRVEAVVAEGGFAVVYRAYHAGFRAPVALKCLKIPQYLSDEERTRFEGQFQAEAELLFKLSASIPAVVRPLHVEAIVAPDGSFMPFLALEWLDGETLDAVAKGRAARGLPPFGVDELIALLTPVARALERAHNFVGPEGPVSIVHRDMKPENVFVARVAGESVVKILDFGIATAKSMASQVAGRASQSGGKGVASFTPAYGAPEQWLPKRFGQTGPWTDVWGFALTMVESLRDDPSWTVTKRRCSGRSSISRAAQRRVPKESRSVTLWSPCSRARSPSIRETGIAMLASSGTRSLLLVTWTHSGALGHLGDPGNLIPDLDLGTGPAMELDLERMPPPSRSNQGPRSSHQLATPPAVREPSQPTPPKEPPDEFLPTEADLPTEPVDAEELPAPAAPVLVASSGIASAAQRPAPAARPTGSLDFSRFSNIEDGSGTVPELVRRFGPAAGMIVAGVLVSLADGAYATAHGEVFTLGPFRLAWLVAVLVLSGIGLALYRAFGGAGDR